MNDYKLEQVGTLLPTELNAWLDAVVKESKKANDKELRKYHVLTVLVEYLKGLKLDWSKIKNAKQLKQILKGDVKQ